MNFISASSPKINGKMPHLLCEEGDIGEIVLLPGDPGRVELFQELCEEFRIISRNREYTIGTGYYKDMKISVCSTGIGAASTEIAVAQLIGLGAKALIRIGGTGVLKKEIPCGSMIINTGAMRLGGTSTFYAPLEYPAVASVEVIDSLIEACEESHIQDYTGLCASIASFYHGQGRALPYEKEYDEASQLEKYQKLNLVNLEMEAETTYTMASLQNIYAGSICSVHCNRVTDQWEVDNAKAQRRMCMLALEGAWKLNKRCIKGGKES